MCTAITYYKNGHYFGRNLDYEYPLPCAVIITPREYPFAFRNGRLLNQHYAIIGMGMIKSDYPLYYDATNEFGLSIAGLNFPGNAVYLPEASHRNNLAPYELIPWLLGKCQNVAEARNELEQIHLSNTDFSETLTLSPLHWIISDSFTSITVEPLKDGIKVYENPIGVLTNNPPFDYHMQHINDYMNLTAGEAQNRFSHQVSLNAYSRGMGAIGLPGDLSSASRFVRAAFTKLNASADNTTEDSITQFFHILDAVKQTDGCALVGKLHEKTLYSSCCDMDHGVYYYCTYENRRITAIDMHRPNLNSRNLFSYQTNHNQEIRMGN